MSNFLSNVKHAADNDDRITGAYNILTNDTGKRAFIVTPFNGDYQYNRLCGTLEPIKKAPASLTLKSHENKDN